MNTTESFLGVSQTDIVILLVKDYKSTSILRPSLENGFPVRLWSFILKVLQSLKVIQFGVTKTITRQRSQFLCFMTRTSSFPDRRISGPNVIYRTSLINKYPVIKPIPFFPNDTTLLTLSVYTQIILDYSDYFSVQIFRLFFCIHRNVYIPYTYFLFLREVEKKNSNYYGNPLMNNVTSVPTVTIFTIMFSQMKCSYRIF